MSRCRKRHSGALRWIGAAKLAALAVLAGVAMAVLLILLLGACTSGKEAPVGSAPERGAMGVGNAGSAGATGPTGATRPTRATRSTGASGEGATSPTRSAAGPPGATGPTTAGGVVLCVGGTFPQALPETPACGAGGVCDMDADCAHLPGNYCKPLVCALEGCLRGWCTLPKVMGEPCTRDAECASGRCRMPADGGVPVCWVGDGGTSIRF